MGFSSLTVQKTEISKLKTFYNNIIIIYIYIYQSGLSLKTEGRNEKGEGGSGNLAYIYNAFEMQ